MSGTGKIIISYDVAVNLATGWARWSTGEVGVLEQMLDGEGRPVSDRKDCKTAVFRVDGRLRTINMRDIRGFYGGRRHETPSSTAEVHQLGASSSK